MKHALNRNAASVVPTIDWQKMEAGYFRASNDSLPGWEWFHMVSSELVNILTLNGVTPGETLNQVGTLIKSLKDAVSQFSLSLSDHDIRLQKAYPIGGVLFWPDATNPAGFMVADGRSAPRSGAGSFPSVTQAIDEGKLTTVSMASWGSTPGRFGSDLTNVRFPDFRSQILKAYHEGSATRTSEWTSALGRWQLDAVLRHAHIQRWLAFNGGAGGWIEEARGAPDVYTSDTWTDNTGGDENLVRNMSVRVLVRVY